MSSLVSRTLRLGLVLVALVVSAAPAAEELPVLERYSLDSLGERRGLVYELYDQSFGGGDAEARLRLRRTRSAGSLTVRVSRTVRRGQVSFALLGERVEVRGYSGDDQVLYSRDFAGLEKEGIYFGDSRSGNWVRKLSGIPAEVRRIEVTFYGNYE
ncbi:MAG: hypothetical protein ACK47B_07305 [Armatimonadota bacterium]